MRTLLASSTVLFTILFSVAFGVACGHVAISAILRAFGQKPKAHAPAAATVAVTSASGQ